MTQLLSPQSLAPGHSITATLPLSNPTIGAAILFSVNGATDPSGGVDLSTQVSLDSTLFSDASLISRLYENGNHYAVVSALGCSEVLFTVQNNSNAPVQIALQADQG